MKPWVIFLFLVWVPSAGSAGLAELTDTSADGLEGIGQPVRPAAPFDVHEIGHYALNHIYESIIFFGIVEMEMRWRAENQEDHP